MTEFVFDRYDTIGANAAEEDRDYLHDCFVNMGELPILQNVNDLRFLVVGRTGSGKTALFMRLAEELDNCRLIDADTRGFCYTEKSTILNDLSDKGINLAPYLKLLWMHVLVIEIIQEVVPVEQKESITARLKSLFSRRNVKEETAIRYLEEHQGEFWTDTTEKTKKISEEFSQAYEKIRKSEGEAIGRLGGVVSAGGGVSDEDQTSTSHSVQTTYEVEKRGVEIISSNLASKIGTIPALIDTLLKDKRKIVYIAIDRIDESVISDTFRYQSLRGLIDAIRELNRSVDNLKIVVSIRTDLLDCILKRVEIPGQQYEKYKSLFLQLKWNKRQLTELAEKRVQKLVRKRYQPKAAVLLHELFPEKMHFANNQSILFEDYLIQRSWDRPRDIIDFINCCIAQAEGNSHVTQDMVRQAEKYYSRDRYSSLQEEWNKTIPEIEILLGFLSGMQTDFCVAEIGEEKAIDWVIAVLKDGDSSGKIYRLASEYEKRVSGYADFRNACFEALYDAGVIGIKFTPTDTLKWSYREGYAYESDVIQESSLVRIHPALWAYYGINE